MKRYVTVASLMILALAVLVGCSSKPAGDAAKKVSIPLQTIQGKIQVLEDQGGSTDSAMNLGGPSLLLWQGARRYRLFVREAVKVEHGKHYVVEGVDAQKAIEEIGDPDQGKNGYPLQSSCAKVIKAAWPNLAFDAADSQTSVLMARIKRYPARPILLVTKLRPVDDEAAAAKEDESAGEKGAAPVTVPAEKQKALLAEGSTTIPAPLWQPEGGVANCKVAISADGKISALQTGQQLCEAVDWTKFKFQPMLQGGKPVRVESEVAVTFEPRK
jgi:hypothetical protein